LLCLALFKKYTFDSFANSYWPTTSYRQPKSKKVFGCFRWQMLYSGGWVTTLAYGHKDISRHHASKWQTANFADWLLVWQTVNCCALLFMIYYVTVFHVSGVGTFYFLVCVYACIKDRVYFHQSSFSIVVLVTETQIKTKSNRKSNVY